MNNSAPDDASWDQNGSQVSFKETALQLLKPFASLQLTVVLFSLSLVLVFFGTMAQMNEGIWTVVDKYFRSGIVWIPTQLIAKFGITFFHPIFDSDTHWHGSFPFFGGWTLGTAMLVNLLAAHLVRFRMTWKRSGIFVIHAGVILLMVGELITGLYAVESTMTLAVGETCNFVDETLTVELAISHPLDSNTNDVVKVPASMLKRKGVISSPDLPVDVEVLEYWKNSSIEEIRGPAPDDTWLPLGNGRFFRAIERPEEAGVETEQRGDATSVRVRLKKKGTNEEVGHFILSLWYYPNSTMNSRNITLPPFQFSVDGQQYTIELRNRRHYKPYSIRLLKFEHAKYEGTEMAKDFASTVEVIDPDYGNSESRIWMNNPLRYRDSSYYQLQVLRQDSGTVLQVVHNPGRILPYLACLMVSLGLLLHFTILLVRFLERQLGSAGTAKEARRADRSQGWAIYFPALVVGLAAIWLAGMAMPPTPKPVKIDYYEVGKIPVLHNGRVKPLSTVAQTALQAISGQSEVQDIQNGKRKFAASAVEWYFAGFNSPSLFSGKAADYKVFRIDNDQVLSLLNLKPRPEFFRYSLAEIEPNFSTFRAELDRVQDKKDKKLNLRDSKVLELGKKLAIYRRMVQGEPDRDEMRKGETPNLVPPQADGEKWLKMKEVDDRIVFTKEEENNALKQAFEKVQRQFSIRDFDDLPLEARRAAAQLIQSVQQQILAEEAPDRRNEVNPAAAAFTELARLSDAGQTEAFNQALASYREKYLLHVPQEQIKDARFETFFNHFAPFYLCAMLYVIIIVLAALSWLTWREPLLRAAFGLGILTFLLHTCALLSRMYLQGRPPVTNLYSSAVFIGWGCLLVCLILEGIYWKGIGIVVGGILGALTMMIAHFLSEGGDTMEMLQAVLDTNFWLATHVTCVTFGYMATFVAGFIALLYVVLGVFTKIVDGEMNKTFGKMLYGVICLATFLSFTGTVLGGIWADYSWGRFWGWDAKENGAVMVVIWNTLILHARWAGLVKLRGMAVLAIAGNIFTIWSWFGTNQLGAGLHSYGFSTELAERCMWSWIVLFALILLGLLPQQIWRSFSPETIRERAAQAKRDAQDRKEMEKREAKRDGRGREFHG